MASPTITPSFPEFLPPWVGRQPWYRGSGVPSLALVGAFRLEDPAGEVGIETHLLSDGTTVYQVPMTYRDAPLPGAAPATLIATAEHSVLGARWIYDATADPVWRAELTQLVRDSRTSDMRARNGVITAAVRGRPVDAARLRASELDIELRRVLTAGEPAGMPISMPAGMPAGEPATQPGIAGLVTGTWRLAGSAAVTGCLAVVRLSPSGRSRVRTRRWWPGRVRPG